jgi:hypothetical protein
MKKITDRKRRESSKPKKITVKFFVNEMVQPLIDGKTKRYPLYMLITYDRKNTMMRCHYGQYYKDLKEIDKINYPGLLAMEERIIKKTIEYELKQRRNSFDLKGTYKKYEQYSVGIHVLVERYLKDYLWSVLSRLEPFEYAKALKFTDPDVTFDTLYKISKRIYKDLDNSLPRNFEQEIEVYRVFHKLYQGTFFQYSFPVVIEWIDSSAVDDYREKLKTFYSDDPSMVKKSVEFINRIVTRG